jgi:hypothetical protein
MEAAMFVDRQEEIAFLNDLLTRKHPGPAQLISDVWSAPGGEVGVADALGSAERP